MKDMGYRPNSLQDIVTIADELNANGSVSIETSEQYGELTKEEAMVLIAHLLELFDCKEVAAKSSEVLPNGVS